MIRISHNMTKCCVPIRDHTRLLSKIEPFKWSRFDFDMIAMNFVFSLSFSLRADVFKIQKSSLLRYCSESFQHPTNMLTIWWPSQKPKSCAEWMKKFVHAQHTQREVTAQHNTLKYCLFWFEMTAIRNRFCWNLPYGKQPVCGQFNIQLHSIRITHKQKTHTCWHREKREK